jgi:hypothetical protein
MKKKRFKLKSQNCFREAKKAPLFLHCSKNGSKQNRADLVGDLAGDVGAFFFVLLKHCSNFFRRSDFTETLPETSEQIFCTNVASEQKKSGKVLQRLLRCKSTE